MQVGIDSFAAADPVHTGLAHAKRDLDGLRGWSGLPALPASGERERQSAAASRAN
jgi:hypothetical protein